MKKITTILLFVFGISGIHAQQNIGIGTVNPMQKLHISGAGNTLRIEGIGTGGSFLAAPTLSTQRLLFANTNGDIYSIPAGSNGNVMTINSSGIIQWMTPAGSGNEWRLT